MRIYTSSSCSDTIVEIFEHIPQFCCFIKECFFSGKNSWDYCLQVLDYQDFLIIRHWITRILLCLFPSMF